MFLFSEKKEEVRCTKHTDLQDTSYACKITLHYSQVDKCIRGWFFFRVGFRKSLTREFAFQCTDNCDAQRCNQRHKLTIVIKVLKISEGAEIKEGRGQVLQRVTLDAALPLYSAKRKEKGERKERKERKKKRK